MENREVSTEELKVNALLERIAQLENDKADLRVAVTVLNQRNEQLEAQLRGINEKENSEPSNNTD